MDTDTLPGNGPGLKPTIRVGAERSLLLVIVSFVVAVVGTRWFLQLTGYPQVGGGELHIAHMLWGGLALVVGALLVLTVSASWVTPVVAILTGAGTGLFIDEVGKFITASNDYFYPLAAPLIYGLFLALAMVFVLVRNRAGDGAAGSAPADADAGRAAGRVSRRTVRRLLVVLLGILGLGWLLTFVLFVALDEATVNRVIDAIARVPGDRVERPSEPLFYYLEAFIFGAAGVALVVGAFALARGRDGLGTGSALVGLVIALTAGALVSLYVEQVSAILTTVYQALLLVGVTRYRTRYVGTGGPAA